MEKLFVTFDLASKLKDKGFDEFCFAFFEKFNRNDEAYYEFKLCQKPSRNSIKDWYYMNDKTQAVTTPLYQQCVDWLREKHGIELSSPCKKDKDLGVFYGGYIKKHDDDFGKSYGSNFRDYYEAYNHGIEEALKLI